MKRLAYLSLLCFMAYFGFSKESLYTSLVDVNNRWAYENDIPKEIFEMDAQFDPVQTHLLWVHYILSKRDVSFLSAAERDNREQSLSVLKEYALAKEFPNNVTHKERRPVFIAPNGNYCAVGFLIKESGCDDLAKKISANMNYQYLLNMDDEELNAWVNKSGFTAEELAWIQPGYMPVSHFKGLKEGVNGPVNAIGFSSQGNLIVGGNFDTAGSVSASGIAEFYPGFSGYDWTPFGGSGVQEEIHDMVYYNGDLVVAGNIYTADTSHIHSSVAVWRNGSWESVGAFYVGALQNIVYDLEVYNGELYAAGQFRGVGITFSHIAKWNGTDWEGLGATPNAPVKCLSVYNNKLILGGDFTDIGNTAYAHVAAYDGSSFSPLNSGVPVAIETMEVVGDSLFAGGEFLSQSTLDTFGFGYYHNNQWERIKSLDYGPLENKRVVCLENTPYGLFVGGDLEYFGSLLMGKNLLQFSNGQLHSYGYVDSTVNALMYDAGNEVLYIGGDFVAPFVSHLPPYALKHIMSADLGSQFSLDDEKYLSTELFPNPSQGSFEVSFKEAVRINTVKLYDMSGKEVSLETKSIDAKKYQVTLKSPKKGTYFFTADTDKGVAVQKLIVE